MKRGRKMRDFSNNWNPRWYPVLECGAKRLLASFRGPGRRLCDVEELIDELWLKCVRRLPSDELLAGNVSWEILNKTLRVVLRSYTFKAWRYGVKIESLGDKEGGIDEIPDRQNSTDTQLDEVDHIGWFFRRLEKQKQQILLQRLKGKTYEQIAKPYGRTGEWARLELKKIGEIYNEMQV